MNELYELLNLQPDTPLQKVIDALKQGKDKSEIFEKAKQELDPLQHKVMDQILRPGKEVKQETTDTAGNKIIKKVWVEPNRIAIAYQKLIVKKAKAFLFGNQPLLNSNAATKQEKEVVKAIERILHDIKESSFNRRIAESVSSYTEGGESWYFTKGEPHETYGFKTDLKVKVMPLTPKTGELLYPYKDEKGDLLVFSRQFSLKEDGKDVQYFEVHTANNLYLFKQEKSWEVIPGYPMQNLLGKIPDIFAEQDFTEWYDIQWAIERLELLISNHAQINDKHSAPLLAFSGKVKSFLQRGEGGAIELENGAKAEYISWNNATDSIKLEIENLIKYIHMITQTPNISFDEVKNLGALSGTALKMLFFDAHLKVMDKREIYDEYLQRRINLLKRVVGVMNPYLKNIADNLIIEPEIVPFMVENEKEQVEINLLKNGNKPLESHEKSVKNWQGQDTEDFQQILKEEKESQMLNYFNPTSVE